MLDDLRDQAEGVEYSDETGDEYNYDYYSAGPQRILGMTPIQRFIIVVMILMMTCIMGSFCLLVTEKVAPPFL